MSPESIPFFVLGSLSAAVIFLLLSVTRKLKAEGEKAMASFQLNPEMTIREFELFLAGSVVMFAGFVAFLGAGITGSELLLNIGRTGAAFYLSTAIYILARWRARF